MSINCKYVNPVKFVKIYLANRSQIMREQGGLDLASPGNFLCLNIEAAQPINQLAGYFARSQLAPPPIGIGQTVKQGRGGGGKRHFKVQGEGFIIDSGHTGDKNKYGTLSQSMPMPSAMSAERRSLTAARP